MAAGFFSGPLKMGPQPTRAQMTADGNTHAARVFFPGSRTFTKKLIYVTWQLFYTFPVH